MSIEKKKKYAINVVTEISKEDYIYNYISELKFIINGIGHQYGNDMLNSCDYRVSSDFELIFVWEGENQIEIDGIRYHGNPGDLFVIPPFSRNRIQTTIENPHNNYWIHFNLEPYYQTENFLNVLIENRENYCIKVVNKEVLWSYFRIIEEEMRQERTGYKVIRENCFSSIIVLLMREHMEQNQNLYIPALSKRDKRNMDIIMQYIEENLHTSFRIEDIAAHVHLSTSYIFKLFSRNVNSSPNAYIQIRKAVKAKLFMETTEMTLTEIAEQLGFTNYSYFSLFFKNIFGMSPREYRIR